MANEADEDSNFAGGRKNVGGVCAGPSGHVYEYQKEVVMEADEQCHLAPEMFV